MLHAELHADVRAEAPPPWGFFRNAPALLGHGAAPALWNAKRRSLECDGSGPHGESQLVEMGSTDWSK